MAAGGGSEPNLTPFIDLFSVLVCFLLMTAAWLQLESLQVQTGKNPEPTAAEDTMSPPDDLNKTRLAISLFTDHIVAKENDTETMIPNVATGMDKSGLENILHTWRSTYPNKHDIVLNSDATVTYGAMISAYDTMIGSDWPDVGINPN